MKLRHRYWRGLWLPVTVVLTFLSGSSSVLCVEIQREEEQQYDSRALSHFLDADLYMMQGDYDEAVAAYERALAYDSSSATIYLGLGEALLLQGNLERSRLAGEKAQRLQPDDLSVYEFLSRNAAARDDLASAVGYLDKWAELDASDLEPLFHKAELLRRQKKFTEAIDVYIAIHDRDPMQQQVLPLAGDLALATGDLERAYQAYVRLYQQRREDPRIARAFAEVCVRTKRFKEALEAYEQLEQSGQATLASKLQLAWLYLQLKEPDKAQALLAPLIEEGYRQWDVLTLSGHIAERMSDNVHLEKVATLLIEVYPDSIGGYTSLAIARNNQDDEKGATEVLEQAVQRFPDDPDVNYLLGNLYYGDERYADAERHLLLALSSRPAASYIQHLLATTWSSLGKYDPSDSLYEALLKTESDDATVMNNYAYSIAERPDVSKQQLQYARRLSRTSLKLQQDNAAFLDTYGWILFRLERYRQAKRFIAKSIELRPDHPVVLEHLAEVYLKLGEPDQAEIYLERAQQIRKQEAPSMVRAPED